MHKRIFRLFVPSLVFAVEACAAASPCAVAVNLTAVKGSFMAGEPIELRLTANNRGSEPVSIFAAYPTFEAGTDSGLKFSLAGEHRALRASEPQQKPSIVASLRVPILPLAPGEIWSVSVFLQRFMPDLPPGSHRIQYSARLECLGQNNLPAGVAQGEGVLPVIVLDTGEPALTTAIAELASRLDVTGFWERRSVEEGLLVANSPLAIPYLRKIMRGEEAAVIRALAKFPGNPDAQDIVVGVVREGTIAEAGLALSVMEDWKYLLSESDLAGVMTRGNSWLRMVALRYAEAVGSKTLIPALSAYAEDADLQVAAEAKRVIRSYLPTSAAHSR